MLENLRKKVESDGVESDSDENNHRYFTLVIVSTMFEHESAFKKWQAHEANLSRHKKIILESVAQKSTDYGTSFAVTSITPNKKLSLAEVDKVLFDVKECDDTPQIRAVFPQ